MMLDPADVDEAYLTPVASTTLANIFKENSSNDESVNTSLKYKAPQQNNSEKSTRSDVPNSARCDFSCSVLAYEWIQGVRKCAGKVGFAIMTTVKSGLCKMVLYSPEKTTLSCTRISPQLKVTLKHALITFYDDHKKNWELCFNDKLIHEVKELLQKENVIIDHYESRQLNYVPVILKDIIHVDNTADQRDNDCIVVENASISNNEKATILSRIANVGHAILPKPASPIKTAPLVMKISETNVFTDRLNMPPEESVSKSPQTSEKDLTRNIAVQAGINDFTHCSKIVSDNISQPATQCSATSLLFVNIPEITNTDECAEAVHAGAPDIKNGRCDITTADIEHIIAKLSRFHSYIKILETFENNSTIANHPADIDQYTDKISELEVLVQEKEDIIFNLQSAVENEKEKSTHIIKQLNDSSKSLKEELEETRQDLVIKEQKIRSMISKSKDNSLIASTVKKLMNDTFRSLSSNFENEVNYSGNDIKVILAAVIKKCTVKSLQTVLNNSDVASISAKPAD